MPIRSRRAAVVLDPWRTPVRVTAPPKMRGERAGLAPSLDKIGARLDPGRRLGRFRILEQIGEGGMGRIYAAWDTRFDRKVALKVLVGASEDETRRTRLKREARALATIAHPNVVAFLDFCRVAGNAFTVMKYLDGATLRKLIQRAPLPHVQCLEVGTQIVSGLAAIHDAGIVHRDLKPENVQVSSSGRVKILDLGLSIWLEPRCDAADLREGREGISGTVPYMAPEQFRGGRADYRSDIFAFGVMLHEMLTGELPVLARAPSCPAGSTLEQTASRCLRMQPEERYGSARELADALSAAAASCSSSPNAQLCPSS